MLNREDENMAYIAGLLDGDGSFSMIREKRSHGYSYYPCIQISNVFEGMISFFHETFGGCKKLKSLQSHGKRVQFVWNVRGMESCKKVLERVIPYLVLKKKQAKILLDSVKNPLIDEVDDIRLKIQSLNNGCLVSSGSVVKQAYKNTEDRLFWAYFAGILDTEGSFSVRKNKPSHGCINYKYNPIIQLSMASFEAMNFIRKNICLGKICFPKAETTQRGYVYRLSFGKVSDCIEIIERISPYIKFKKVVALELLNFCRNYKPIKYKQQGVTQDELNFRENCHQKIKKLNECGIIKPSLIDSEVRQDNEGQV